jgi:RNA polymerase sigma-70 factor, ECF subfamily
MRAMDSLKPEHREILVMKYVQEHRYEEIAGILSIPRGTVMSRLYHARMELRETLLKLDRAGARPSTEEVK